MTGGIHEKVRDPAGLKPSRQHHASISSSITLGHGVQGFEFTNKDAGQVPFCLYWLPNLANAGVFEITYDMTLSSPHPF